MNISFNSKRAAVLGIIAACSTPGLIVSPAAKAADKEASLGVVEGRSLPPWSKGMLDIHHIQTGRGNAAFLILPDGTTMLVDAGALADDWDKNYTPLTLAPAAPDNSKRPGQWIADYIGQFAPPGMRGLDYALLTHFHNDHYGTVQPNSPRSGKGDWLLTGITDVAERWPIETMVDRGYPGYDFPVKLRGNSDLSLQNYLRFADAKAAVKPTAAQSLAVGRTDQFKLTHEPDTYPGFSIRGIAANGVVWTGRGLQTRAWLTARKLVNASGGFNENPLSAVIKVTYGLFDYVTGGDLTGVAEPDQPDWFDMESRIAPVLGEADVATMNHHGNRDATNAGWLRALKPQVLVQQTWTSDQPGGDVVARATSKVLRGEPRHIFATHIQDATKIAIGPRLTQNYHSMNGHIVIRVNPGGASFEVYILDDRSRDRSVTKHFGPFASRSR